MASTDHAKNVILSAAAPANIAVPTAAPDALNTTILMIITKVCVVISI